MVLLPLSVYSVLEELNCCTCQGDNSCIPLWWAVQSWRKDSLSQSLLHITRQPCGLSESSVPSLQMACIIEPNTSINNHTIAFRYGPLNLPVWSWWLWLSVTMHKLVCIVLEMLCKSQSELLGCSKAIWAILTLPNAGAIYWCFSIYLQLCILII